MLFVTKKEYDRVIRLNETLEKAYDEQNYKIMEFQCVIGNMRTEIKALHAENEVLKEKMGKVTQKKQNEAFDVVKNPSHYCDGRKYEPRKVIRDWNLNFNLGNAVKYISRAGRKADALEDLKKAKQYLEFEIEELENNMKYKKDSDAFVREIKATPLDEYLNK